MVAASHALVTAESKLPKEACLVAGEIGPVHGMQSASNRMLGTVPGQMAKTRVLAGKTVQIDEANLHPCHVWM